MAPEFLIRRTRTCNSAGKGYMEFILKLCLFDTHSFCLVCMFISWGLSVGRDCDAQLQHTKLFLGAVTWSPADLCTRDPSV